MAELLTHKSLNLICGLTFKFKVLAYPPTSLPITWCMTHNDVVFMCNSRPLENHRDLHNTNKLENVCHAAPAYNFEPFELSRSSLSLSLSVIKTRTFSCGHCQRQGVVAAACGRALILRKFTKTVVIADSDAFCVFSAVRR